MDETSSLSRLSLHCSDDGFMTSIFTDMLADPSVELCSRLMQCKVDENPRKINSTVAAYYSEDSKLLVLPLVRRIIKILAEDSTLDYDFLPSFGLETYVRAAINLMLGKNHTRIANDQVFGIQTIGGSGALQLSLAVLKTVLNRNVVYTSNPMWGIHKRIFQVNGFDQIRTYRYWHPENKCLDFEGMCQDLENAPENAVIVLQACGHNPTGCDPTREQWARISKIAKERKLFPIFDCAFLGLVSGNVDEDAWAVRYFANQGHELFCALSFTKTFTIYGLRVGTLIAIVNDSQKVLPLKTHFQKLIEGSYVVPPSQGARIVEKILTTPQYFEEWKDSLCSMCNRMKGMRKSLHDLLEARTGKGQWKFVIDQVGQFAFAGFPVDVVETLKERYHIYLPYDGRINIPSLNEENLDYFVSALIETLEALDKNKRYEAELNFRCKCVHE